MNTVDVESYIIKADSYTVNASYAEPINPADTQTVCVYMSDNRGVSIHLWLTREDALRFAQKLIEATL